MATRTRKTGPLPPKRLYRSETDRIIGGVCGGIAEFFAVDSTLIRVLFILLVVFGGSGILLYLLLWLFIPTKSKVTGLSEKTIEDNAREIGKKAEELAGEIRTENTRIWVGVILLGLGVIFLLQSFGLFWFNLGKLWPLILVALGVAIIWRDGRK